MTDPDITDPGRVEVLEGQWRVERKLGEGGMGSVLLARDLTLKRRVAIKIMSKSLIDDAGLVARFEREAQIMARLDHPNLVPIYAVGRREGAPFIVMKYLDGQSLERIIETQSPMSLRDGLPLIRQLVAALQYLHESDVVHRDLKPANVFVADSGLLTLLDLGVARESANTSLTRSGEVVGTPRYMAPEQILTRPITPATDIYALGAIVYELLTGSELFAQAGEFEILHAHVREPPPNIEVVVPSPSGLNAVLQKALAKDPNARFASATAFLAALEALAAGPVPSKPRPRKATAEHPPVPAITVEAPRKDTIAEKPERKALPKWLVPAAIGLTVLIGLGVAVGMTARGNDEQITEKPQRPSLPQVIDAEAPTPDALYRQSIDLKRGGDVDAAVMAAEKCTKLFPNHAPCYRSLGSLYSEITQRDGKEETGQKARAAYQQYLKLVPADDPYVPQVKSFLRDADSLWR